MVVIHRWLAFGLACLCLFGAGCGDDGDDGYAGPRYLVTGRVQTVEFDSSLNVATCSVSLDGQPVTGAHVVIDGVVATLNAEDVYVVALSPQGGDEVAFEVTVNDFWAFGSVTMPSTAGMIAPTGTHDASQPITVEWVNGSFVAERVQVSVMMTDTASGTQWNEFVDGTATSADIPGGTVKPGLASARAFIVQTNRVHDLGPCAGDGSYVEAACTPSMSVFSTQ